MADKEFPPITDDPGGAAIEMAWIDDRIVVKVISGGKENVLSLDVAMADEIRLRLGEAIAYGSQQLRAARKAYRPLPRMEVREEVSLENCYGCGVAPETPHGKSCDHAMCPDCGDQLIQCDEHEDDPARPAIWHGVDPAVEVARKLGWWTVAAGLPDPVEDSTRVMYAKALHQITWNKETQRYDIGTIDEVELRKQQMGL